MRQVDPVPITSAPREPSAEELARMCLLLWQLDLDLGRVLRTVLELHRYPETTTLLRDEDTNRAFRAALRCRGKLDLLLRREASASPARPSRDIPIQAGMKSAGAFAASSRNSEAGSALDGRADLVRRA